MSRFDQPPLHDFPDRAFRELLSDSGNLRDLIAVLMPDLVDRLDFPRREILPRTFLLDDWRRRESDLLVRLPWLPGASDDPPLLVCLLIEHQSEPDPPMPLRTLLYATLHWQKEWQAWEQQHPRGKGLWLTPVAPIVFHTGQAPWRTHRTLATLIRGPGELAAFAPIWEPRFWDLAEHPTEELLGSVGDFLVALAVVREERASSPVFREVFAAVLRRLEGLSDRDRVRWEGLLFFVLSWGVRRRPGEEQESLLGAARESQAGVRHQEEVRRMSETVVQTWEQELVARGRAEGLAALQQALQEVVRSRFPAVSSRVTDRIERVRDVTTLATLIGRAAVATRLEEIERLLADASEE